MGLRGLLLLLVLAGCGTDSVGAVGDDAAPGDGMGVVDAAPEDAPPEVDLAAEVPDLPSGDLTLQCRDRCPNGCCEGEVCQPPSALHGCATGGVACAPCPAESDSCVAGACSCGNLGAPCPAGLECLAGACKCTPKTCAGCCADATTCVSPATAKQCGDKGGACTDCGPSADECAMGICRCAGGPPCGMSALCDPGKGCACEPATCGQDPMCTPVGLNACGMVGGACMMCDPRQADGCDGKSGSCTCGGKPACGPGYYCDTTGAPTCLCDPLPKTGCPGCCSKDGLTCVGVQTDKECGLDGSTCADCVAAKGKCNLMTGTCAACAMNCAGCCTGAECTPLANQDLMSGCGKGGAACGQCDVDSDRCLDGGCSCGDLGHPCAAGQECIAGKCQCTPNSCPLGCCGGGACQMIDPAHCGKAPGGLCAACDPALADRCVQGECSCGPAGNPCVKGQRCDNGACICDDKSCPMGCCAGTLCAPLGVLSCGKPGGACMACDQKVADGCTNGACTCGGQAQCPAGLVCTAGACRCPTNPCASCALAALTRSYIGCEYWPTVTSQGAWSIFDFAVAVANPQPVAATVTTTGPGNFMNVTTVQPGALEKIYLPWVTSLKGTDASSCGSVSAMTASVMERDGAYKVASSVPVSVFQFNALEYVGAGGPPGKNWAQCPGTVQVCPTSGRTIGCYSFTNDASLLLPTTAMTGSYRVGGMNGVLGAFMAITGTAPNTQVTVRLTPTATVQASSGNVIPAVGGNGVVNFTLGPGDVAEVTTPFGTQYDFSGSLVEASSPVQVITGNRCTNIPANASACDHIEESVLPAETLGKKYAVTRPTGPLGSAVGHVVRIYGNFDNTKLNYDPAPMGQVAAPGTVQAGSIYDLGVVSNDFVVTGDQAFLVMTFQQGASVVDPATPRPNQQGDPSQTQAVAIEQYRTQYIFLAPSDYNVSYADIVVPAGVAPVLDGVGQNGAPAPIGNSGYGVLRVKLGPGNNGAHTITAPKPVGLQVMGYGSYTSYGYPGGLDLFWIAPKPMDL